MHVCIVIHIDTCQLSDLLSVFRLPWSIIYEKEGENDGLVSVESAMWGNYKVRYIVVRYGRNSSEGKLLSISGYAR
jgi:hypothetical protein